MTFYFFSGLFAPLRSYSSHSLWLSSVQPCPPLEDFTTGLSLSRRPSIVNSFPGLLGVRFPQFVAVLPLTDTFNALFADSNSVGLVANVASIDWGCAVWIMAAASIGSDMTFAPTLRQTL